MLLLLAFTLSLGLMPTSLEPQIMLSRSVLRGSLSLTHKDISDLGAAVSRWLQHLYQFAWQIWAGRTSVQEGKTTVGKGGSSLQLDINNKPSLYNSNAMSQTVFTLLPCGLNVPHVHPRAGKVVFVLQGNFLGWRWLEDSIGISWRSNKKQGTLCHSLFHILQCLACVFRGAMWLAVIPRLKQDELCTNCRCLTRVNLHAGEVSIGFVEENGGRSIGQNVSAGQSYVIPQGNPTSTLSLESKF